MTLRGSLNHPEVSVAKEGVLAQSAVAVALGVLLSPLASLLAFVSPGLTHNADCDPLLSQAQALVNPSDIRPREVSPRR